MRPFGRWCEPPEDRTRRSGPWWPPGLLCLVGVGLAGCGGLGRNDNALGVQLYQQGNYLGAVNHFQQALARQPGNADCFYNLGATYHQQAKLFARPADLETAEQYYHLCLARNPDHEACRRGLAVLLVEENRRDEAVAQLRQWSAGQPANPNPHIELARLAEEQGNLSEAEKELNAALAVSPTNPRALVAIGRLHEATGQSAAAYADYSRALAANPNQPLVASRAAALAATSPSGIRTAALPPAPPPYPGMPVPPAGVPVAR